MITIDKDQFEHLLNCMCNQKYIFEMSEEVQKEWQETIDKAYHEARAILHKSIQEPMNHECPGVLCTAECNQPMGMSSVTRALDILDQQYERAQKLVFE